MKLRSEVLENEKILKKIKTIKLYSFALVIKCGWLYGTILPHITVIVVVVVGVHADFKHGLCFSQPWIIVYFFIKRIF